MSEISEERTQLLNSFESSAQKKGIVPCVTDRSVRDLELTRILYDEQLGSRQISIVLMDGPDNTPPYIDAFIKKTGLNFEVSLLHISVSSAQPFQETLWELYLRWLHEGVAEQEITAALQDLRRRRPHRS